MRCAALGLLGGCISLGSGRDTGFEGSTSLEGDWEGECELPGAEAEIELEIEDQGLDGSLEGEGTAAFTAAEGDSTEFSYGEGAIEGEIDGDDVELRLILEGLAALEMEGELEERGRIEGKCAYEGQEGDLELERD